MSQVSGAFKIRVGVLLVKGDWAQPEALEVLMLRQNDRPFWVFPGGTLEPEEGMAACAKRELMEEAGITIELGPLLHCADLIKPHQHVLDVLFLARYQSGPITFTAPHPENINEMRFVPMHEFKALPVKPEAFHRQAIEGLNSPEYAACWQAFQSSSQGWVYQGVLP
jgi:8-oxo-dGTP pyrophosphatase MutT (NUDIX family)